MVVGLKVVKKLMPEEVSDLVREPLMEQQMAEVHGR